MYILAPDETKEPACFSRYGRPRGQDINYEALGCVRDKGPSDKALLNSYQKGNEDGAVTSGQKTENCTTGSIDGSTCIYVDYASTGV